ncbi:hypothetical protein [Virgibacillus pantothenticus]|uniref:hypothetical protein n=1 Tax=Virgibacillus pantothenticus TaxID=1473 RepID=UPI001BB006EE|nr:hypothetical protein [Virgibacillus pantothenticus]
MDRNDIWANLKRIDSEISSNMFKALTTSYQQPASFFGLFDDLSEEVEALPMGSEVYPDGTQKAQLYLKFCKSDFF